MEHSLESRLYPERFKSQRGGGVADEQFVSVANIRLGVALLSSESTLQLLAGPQHLQSSIY